MMGIRSLWGQQQGRLLVVVVALVIVAGLVVGGLALYRAASDDMWVADESYNFDVCSLVESEDLTSVMGHFNEEGSDPEPVQLSHQLRYVSETESYGDSCGYGDESTGGMAAVTLTVGPMDGSVAADEYWADGESEPVAEVGDDAAFYDPYSGRGGTVVAHLRDAVVEVDLEVHGASASDGGTQTTREYLVSLTESVLERLPEDYVMPGDIADGPCESLWRPASRLFDDDPTYARSFGQPTDVSTQRVRCEFATDDDRHVTLTVKANHPGVREQIQGLEEHPENFDEIDVETAEVYRDENLRHYIVDSDRPALVEVQLSRHGVEREPGEDEPALEGEELERLIDLGEEALLLGV